MIGAGVYVMSLWRQDYLVAAKGPADPRALPGATPAPRKAMIIAALGALVILAGETWGEIRLGLSEEQSKMTVLFCVYSLIAAFIEELIFRGFIVVNGKGATVRWVGVVVASVLFAALHPFLWKWDMGETPGMQALQVWRWSEWFSWQFTPKGWFSAGVVFVSSLWFYFVRFAAFNPRGSLLPSVVAHATKNLGVIVVKAVQGYIVGVF